LYVLKSAGRQIEKSGDGEAFVLPRARRDKTRERNEEKKMTSVYLLGPILVLVTRSETRWLEMGEVGPLFFVLPFSFYPVVGIQCHPGQVQSRLFRGVEGTDLADGPL
jgi:hypothetical protein